MSEFLERWWWAGLLVAVGLVWGFLYWNGPVSAADRATYGAQCRDWISRTMADGRPARVIDAWRRRGHLVFAIATEGRPGSTSGIDFCVIDRSRTMMQKPSIFEVSSWRRWP